jgi:hypothetical protein
VVVGAAPGTGGGAAWSAERAYVDRVNVGVQADGLAKVIVFAVPEASESTTETVPVVVHDPVGGKATTVLAEPGTVTVAVRVVASPLT